MKSETQAEQYGKVYEAHIASLKKEVATGEYDQEVVNFLATQGVVYDPVYALTEMPTKEDYIKQCIAAAKFNQ